MSKVTNNSSNEKEKTKKNPLENPLISTEERAIEAEVLKTFYPLQSSNPTYVTPTDTTHNPLTLLHPKPSSHDHDEEEKISPFITGLPDMKEIINSPEVPFHRKHSTATNHSSDSSGYATATSGHISKNHSINTDAFSDAPSRRQTFTGITNDENYWLETNRTLYYNNNPLRSANHSITSGVGNACNSINETINQSIHSNHSEDDLPPPFFPSSATSSSSTIGGGSKRNQKGGVKISDTIQEIIREESETTKNSSFIDLEKERKETESMAGPVSIAGTHSSGNSSQELDKPLLSTVSISRPSDSNDYLCCCRDYCFPCLDNNTHPPNNILHNSNNNSNTSSSSSSSSWFDCLINCFSCFHLFSSSSFDSISIQRMKQKQGIEVGDLYEFIPTKEIPYFLVYDSPNINHRYYTVIRRPNSILFILQVNGNYKFIQCNGYEGWIYLPNSVIYPHSVSQDLTTAAASTENNNSSASRPTHHHHNYKQSVLRLIDSYPLYKEWNGDNSFFCNGKIMIGKDRNFFLFTLFGILASSSTFFFFVIDDLSDYYIYKVRVM